LETTDGKKPFSTRGQLIKDKEILLADIRSIVVVYNTDTLVFFAGEDFSRSVSVYPDTPSTDMANLIIPTFKEAFFSNDNLYFRVTEEDEWSNKLNLLPDSIRMMMSDGEDKRYWTASLNYHIEESQKIEIKKN
jgi:hypothetical protein